MQKKTQILIDVDTTVHGRLFQNFGVLFVPKTSVIFDYDAGLDDCLGGKGGVRGVYDTEIYRGNQKRVIHNLNRVL